MSWERTPPNMVDNSPFKVGSLMVSTWPNTIHNIIQTNSDKIKKFPNIHYYIYVNNIKFCSFFPINSPINCNSDLKECSNSI